MPPFFGWALASWGEFSFRLGDAETPHRQRCHRSDPFTSTVLSLKQFRPRPPVRHDFADKI